jgi:hypothetical protein
MAQQLVNKPRLSPQPKTPEMRNSFGQPSAQLAALNVQMLSSPAMQRLQTMQTRMADSKTQVQAASDEDEMDFQMIQRLAEDEDEFSAQMIQRLAEDEDEFSTQMVQRLAADEDEFGVQMIQRETTDATQPVQKAAPASNGNGLPGPLRGGIEALSGLSMGDVQVHRNSGAPARIGARAYAQRRDIHLGPGQEQHLPHEAWHVAQQAQGRVRPTMQAAGLAINDDPGLEREADVMGGRAMRVGQAIQAQIQRAPSVATGAATGQRFDGSQGTSNDLAETQLAQADIAQRKIGFEFETPWIIYAPARILGPDTPVITGTGWGLIPDFASTMLATDAQGRPLPLPPELRPTERIERNFFGMEKTVTVPPQYNGFGHLEFVTDAFDESQEGLEQLIETIMHIQAFVRSLADAQGDRVELAGFVRGNIKWSPHAAGFELPTLVRIVVDKSAAFSATPQMTGGIKLSKMPELIEQMSSGSRVSKYMNRGQDKTAANDQGTMAVSLDKAKDQAAFTALAGRWNATQENQYIGAVTHLTNVVLRGKVSYPSKSKYLSTLLSRTDFGKFPDFMKANLKADVLAAAEAQAGSALFNQPGAGDQAKRSALTVGAWLDGIVAGKDPEDWGQDRRNVEKTERWEPQAVGKEGDQEIGHVYEFRGAGTNLADVNDWLKYALGMFEFVRYVNSSADKAGYSDEKKKRIRDLPGI